MDISSNSEKRNRIIGIDYVLNANATVNDFPGGIIQVLVVEWFPIKFTSVTFTESDPTNGEYVAQELNIVLSGTNSNIEKQIRDLTGRELLLRLTYSSGMNRVVGTEVNPVLLSHSSTGSPVQQTLETKRISAEKAKLLVV